MIKSETIGKIAASLVKAQRNIGAATKGAKNPFFKSNYADLSDVMEVTKEPLNDQGISILQMAHSQDGSHYVETVLMHESGEYLSSGSIRLELGNKQDSQALGSAISYMKRYQLQALCFVPSEDDDSEKAMNRPSKPAYEAPKGTTGPKTPNLSIGVNPAINAIQGNHAIHVQEAKPGIQSQQIEATASTPATRSFRGKQAVTVSTGDGL